MALVNKPWADITGSPFRETGATIFNVEEQGVYFPVNERRRRCVYLSGIIAQTQDPADSDTCSQLLEFSVKCNKTSHSSPPPLRPRLARLRLAQRFPHVAEVIPRRETLRRGAHAPITTVISICVTDLIDANAPVLIGDKQQAAVVGESELGDLAEIA